MDIVERLRSFVPPYGWPEEWATAIETPLNEAAAAEITRLRAIVELAVKMRDAQIRCQEADDGETVSTSRDAVSAESAFDAAVKEIGG